MLSFRFNFLSLMFCLIYLFSVMVGFLKILIINRYLYHPSNEREFWISNSICKQTPVYSHYGRNPKNHINELKACIPLPMVKSGEVF